MVDLSSAQTALLVAAATSEAGFVPNPPGGLSARLIKAGFFISAPQPTGPSRLLITQAGRDVLGDAAVPDRLSPTEPLTGNNPDDGAASTSLAGERSGMPPEGGSGSKLDRIVELLRRPTGASIDELKSATGWQAHSIRGAISGAIKKKLGIAVLSTKRDGVRVYSIAEDGEVA